MTREGHLLHQDPRGVVAAVRLQLQDGALHHVLELDEAAHVAQVVGKVVLSVRHPQPGQEKEPNNGENTAMTSYCQK